MKKIFTHLFAVLLLSFVTTSNVWAETIDLVPSEGAYDGTSNYCKTWTSNSEPVVTFSVAEANNMTVGAVGGGFGIARGQNADSNWTFSVAGYKILSYSFNYKLQDGSTAADIVITVNNEAHAVTTTSQLLEVNDVNASAASFTLSGTNETIILTNVTIEAEPLLEDGAVYRFVNVGDATRALSATALADVGTAVSGDSDRSQQWLATFKKSTGVYTFRNLSNGRYLQGNNTKSGGWSLTEESNDFTVTLVSGNYCFRQEGHTNGYAYMHRNGSNDIVSWETSSTSTQWTKIEVEYTEYDLQAVWDEVEALVVPSAKVEAYQEKLDAMFTDQSCTKLNDAYAEKTLDAIKSDANYTGLPAVLRAMVEKVYKEQVNSDTEAWDEYTVDYDDRPNGNDETHKQWDVSNKWDGNYAKKFRVQMYEPYSIEGEITSFLRFNAHCNMDNPTGIYANSNQAIYIMVEGEIEDGAELWVAHQVGHGVTYYYNNVAYTELKEGLNIVPYFADGSHMWINYVVHTYNSETKTFPNKLSDFAPLKIHIEGGYINGFFNAMGDYRASADDGSDNLWGDVDNDEDWDYYKQRAALSGDFVLLGHRQTLLFDFGTWDAEKGYFGVANDGGGIEKALAYWLENIEVPETPNCYGGTLGTFGTFAGSYPNMNLDAENGTINIMLEAWDRIMYSEHATMGLLGKSDIDKMNRLYPGWTAQNTTFDIYNYGSNDTDDTYRKFCEDRDYSDYYNHHGAAVGAPSGYMSGGWRVCNYHYNTMGSIIGVIANEAGPTWGPAHEIGHQHQGVFNLNGQTEVTNNFFSNVAVWYMGMGTSRVNGSQGSLSSVLGAFNTDGNDLYTNNIWAITHLYYRLWLYYHLAGNNTQFWPRLFELCRQVPLVNGGQISGETSLLRFYQHACDAAGEDLTEFFRAHGFFEIMDNRLVGDYSNGTYNVTEEQIETAISTIEAKGYEKNYAILLINDGTSETTVKHDGITPRSLWDGSESAEYGSVTDFIEGNTDVTTAYEATVSADGTVTMSGGEGGVGFLIFNEDGELVSFSNNATFQISDEAAYLLATGKATIVAVDAESETVEAKVDLTAVQANLLSELISTVEALPMETDNSFTHVGFYTTPATESLRAALAAAKETAETGVGLQAAYELLYKEYTVLKESDPASVKVQLDPSLTYIVTNKAYPARTMTVVNNVVYANTGVDTTADAAKWQFKETATAGVYNVYNCSGIYCGTISGSTAVTTTTEQASAKNYTVDDLGNGLWAISLNPAGTNTQFHAAANDSYKIVGWSSGATASQWYITAIEANADAKATAELQALIEKTENLVGTLATIENKYDEIVLQADNSNENYYISCNNPDTQEGDGVKALLDNDNSSYLHSNYHSLSSSNDYLQVNLGTGNELDLFRITGVQRTDASADFPKIIEIKGSTDNQSWTTIATVKDLPQSATSSWERDVISVKSYPYLRFIVTTGTNENMAEGERPYFHMAEFSIFKTVLSATLLDAYAEYSATLTSSLIADAYNGVELGKAWLDYNNATSDELTTYTATLQDKYDALYTAYKKVVDAEKAKLQSIIDDTEGLITQVGTATVTADAKISLLGKLYAERPYTAGGTNDSDYSTAEDGYNLLDGNTGTHFHSDYNYSTMVSPPYIRVDLGEGSTANKFKFNYTTRAASGCAPTTLNVYGSNEQDSNYTLLGTFTSNDGENPLPTAEKTLWTSTEIISATAYRYFKFEVAVSEGYKEENSVKKYYFAISEFGFQKLGEVSATIDQEYTGMVSESLLIDTRRTVNASETMVDYATDYVVTVEQIKAQTAAQQAAYDKLYAAMNNTAALKENLMKLIDDTQALYDKMATDDGAVNEYYSTSALTADNLSEALAMITAAQAVYDNSSATVDAINTAYDNLNKKYTVLSGIEELNVTDREDLSGLIATMQSLLEQTTVNGAVETGNVALQVTDKTAPFYIWNYKPATDDNGIAALIDETDGVANTTSFTGTYWQDGEVDPYTHYLEIDLGVNNVFEDISIDYTTRNSTHADQRPNGLKFLGSNDKETYEVLHSVTSGLPTDANTKWTMPVPIELAKNYRYVRIAVSTEAGYFNMSDFNLYSSSIATVNEFYSTSDIFDCLPAVLRGYSDAKKAVAVYLLSEDYTDAKDALQLQIDALQAIIDGNVDVRTELEDLRGETIELLEAVSTVGETETPVAMQCTDEHAPYYLYCNAEGKLNSWTTDRGGVAALLDVTENDEPDLTTFLHTSYGNIAQDDDLDHYLRLDMGENEALVSFKFNYVGRVGNTANAPKTILIEGSNDCETFEEITTLTGLTTANNATYQSDVISNGKAYRYIRFMVKETGNNSKNNGHPFFALSSFAVTACKTIAVNESTESNITLNLTSGVVADAYNEVYDSGNVLEHYVVQDNYKTAVNELQAAYDAIKLSMLPVVLTTDASNPVLYKIRINRDALKVLGIDDSDAKVPVEDFVRNDDTQSWYFMQGTNSESYDDIQIFPYWYNGAANTTLRLGAASAGDAAGAVTAVEGTDVTNTIQNWYITRASGTEEGWWNIQPEGKANYFSNNGGIANKMGFWNSASDNGSEFQFLLDCPYTDLSIIFGASVARQAEYNAPGYYANAANYNAAYDIASGYVTNANGTDEQYTAALDNLIDAKTALSDGGRVPSDALEDGAVYRIMNLITNTAAGYEYHYIQNSSATIAFPTTPAVDDNSCLWVCKANSDGTYEFVSALGTLSLGWKEGSENAQAFTIADGVVTGAKCMKNSSNVRMALTNEKYGSLAFNHASNDEVQSSNWSTDWYFDKIDDADVKFNVNISSRRFSSLYLPYSVEIPEGVGAFTAVAVDGTAVELVRVADKLDSSRHGTVIPARTPVILYIEDIDATPAGSFEFAYTTEEADLPSDVEANVDIAIIHGCILRTPIQCDAAYRYYILGGKSGDTVSKMYWMYEEYSSDGTIADGNAGTDNGGYISCAANKIYMKVAETLAANSFSMRFGLDSGTTGVDEVNADSGEERVIYDLQGRKLSEITDPGIYIVNGKKIHVK